MNTLLPNEAELHAYADGQLDDAARVALVESYLAANTEARARVEQWQRGSEALRVALMNMGPLPANPRLDPKYIRASMRQRFRRQLALCASLLLVLGLGSAGGWQARSMHLSATAPLPMQDAMEAHRIFATDRLRPVEMNAANTPDLESWLSGRLGRPLALPDLNSYGFRLLGGRLLATADGAAALLLYEDRQGQRVSFYVRPSTHTPNGTSGLRSDQGLSAQYWFRNGYGFAVVGRSDDPQTREVQQAIRSAI